MQRREASNANVAEKSLGHEGESRRKCGRCRLNRRFVRGAGDRDLVFSVNGDADLAIAPLQARSDRLDSKLEIELFEGRRFGPYAGRVSRSMKQSKAPQEMSRKAWMSSGC